MTHNYRIMIVDDEPEMLEGASRIIKALGYDTVGISNGKLAIELIQREKFDLVLCDMLMPEIDGLGVLKEANTLAPDTPFVFFTAYATVDRAVEAMKKGAFDFLEKPIEVDKLRFILERGLRQREIYLERENLLNQLEDKFSFDNIIGKSPEMNNIFQMIESVSASDANVLITGESGTGKELIARSLHARSNRKLKSFVPVNCSAFPEHLFEAELFGYEKGAYTGAARTKAGLLEYASGGTFFLDEVCELPLPLQAKMLRVLQDQQLRRLGSNHLIQVDVRLISASNRNIEDALRHEIIREDFYYRLNVINIHLPPLRDRRGDIPLLAEHFLIKTMKSSPKTIHGFSTDVLAVFERYQWPGNVRELENVVERAVTLSRNDLIGIADLPSQLTSADSGQLREIEELSLAESKQRAIDEVEKNYLFRLLKKYNGNVTKVAAESGMTRRNIHRLLSRHDLDPGIWR